MSKKMIVFVALALLALSLYGCTFTTTLQSPIEISAEAPAKVEKPNAPAVIPPTTKVEEPAVVQDPAPVTCSTPSIMAGISADKAEMGEFLDTVLGKRMTFTNRKVVVPSKAWNDPLTKDELTLVEQTWVKIQVCVVEGQKATVFAGGVEQGINRYENGALLSLKPGLYEFKMRNGEVVIWYPGQETFQQKDLERIFDQIRTGNFDIKSPLAFLAATTDLFSKVPQDLVKERNVQIVPSLDPVVR
jgi:hypothetical protein